jgi:putative isomerase
MGVLVEQKVLIGAMLLVGAWVWAAEPAHQHSEYLEIQKRLQRGWSTHDSRSVTSHVLLPEGLSVSLGLKQTYWLGTYELRRPLVGQRGEHDEVIRPGYHALDGSYSQLELAWRDVRISVEAAHGGDDLIVLVTPLAPAPRPTVLVVELGMLWNRPGALARDGNALVATLPNRRVGISTTATPIEDPYVDATTPYLVLPLDRPVALASGTPRTLAEVAAARTALLSSASARGELRETTLAVLSGLAWNTIYEPKLDRVVSTVGRLWNKEYGGYCLFGWDNFFLAYVSALFSRDLAYANVIEHLRSATDEGLIPNDDRGNGLKSYDRSQPPVGALMVREVYRVHPERWLLEASFEPLLKWNRWWVAKRSNGGLLSYGTHKTINPLNEPAAGTRTGAGYESGMDDSPMYEGVPFNAEHGTLELQDVGLSSLYVADCAALEEIAGILGRSAEQRELHARADAIRTATAALWDDDAGLYLNRRSDTGERSRVLSPTLFYPLLARLPAPERARLMVDRHLLNPEELGGAFMLPSIARNHPSFARQRYWRGAIWPPLNFLVYLGLRNYALSDAQRALATSSRAVFDGEWQRKGFVSENYSAITGTGDDPRLSSDPLHSWGTLMALPALIEKGVLPAPEKPLTERKTP